MIAFERFVLSNGLRVLVHTDKATPMVCVNILYDVGARDESPEQTGFAHLFEHLMFGGSVNIPNYDEPLQRVGGENNAFTSNDITNYYLTLPGDNIETAFWLESDRMLSLAFTEKSLEVQRSVVIEEFKQRYLNQPYGDVWLKLRPLAYKKHPYQWATIGKELSHIENAKMDDVKSFFHRFYKPSNAILVVSGNAEVDNVKRLCEKWFAPIPGGTKNERNLPQEPVQTEPRSLTVNSDAPVDAIYKVWHMCAKKDEHYYTIDVLSDILSRGNSSRFYNELIKNKQLFTDVNAYITGDIDAGLFVVSGKLVKGVTMQQAEDAIEIELSKIKTELISATELTKAKNKMEAAHVFGEMDISNKALSLAVAELLGDANMANTEMERYNAVTAENIMQQANLLLTPNNCSTLYYHAKSN